MKIIIDCNIWISFLIGKNMSKLEILLNSDRITVYRCAELEQEFVRISSKDKIRKYISETHIKKVKNIMQLYCHNASAKGEVSSILRDKNDLYLLSLADNVKADYIITGDKDLLVLGKHNNTEIISFNDFLNTVLN
ncbi:MAG: putative toxin-antitoxin system toxin component, PIN family [Bacteroidales bacterium]|nr:putative toxin-antitoxin system toxin component, PIN family [Bacteroidales bacterium]